MPLGIGTSALVCPGTSDNRGANIDVNLASPSAEPEQPPLILSSLLLLTKVLHRHEDLQGTSPFSQQLAVSFSFGAGAWM